MILKDSFEEWIMQSQWKQVLLLEHAEETLAAMKAAWQADYEQGYQEGVETEKHTIHT